jgi:hypothetical protein
VELYSSMTAALEGGECPAPRPSRTLPPGKTLYPFYRRLGGPQGRSGRTENLVMIRSRTVQPLAQSLYRLRYRAHLLTGGPAINPLTPNDPYRGRTAPLTSKRCILYIYSTNIGTAYFKDGIYSVFSFKMQFVS